MADAVAVERESVTGPVISAASVVERETGSTRDSDGGLLSLLTVLIGLLDGGGSGGASGALVAVETESVSAPPVVQAAYASSAPEAETVGKLSDPAVALSSTGTESEALDTQTRVAAYSTTPTEVESAIVSTDPAAVVVVAATETESTSPVYSYLRGGVAPAVVEAETVLQPLVSLFVATVVSEGETIVSSATATTANNVAVIASEQETGLTTPSVLTLPQTVVEAETTSASLVLAPMISGLEVESAVTQVIVLTTSQTVAETETAAVQLGVVATGTSTTEQESTDVATQVSSSAPTVETESATSATSPVDPLPTTAVEVESTFDVGAALLTSASALEYESTLTTTRTTSYFSGIEGETVYSIYVVTNPQPTGPVREMRGARDSLMVIASARLAHWVKDSSSMTSTNRVLQRETPKAVSMVSSKLARWVSDSRTMSSTNRTMQPTPRRLT